MRLQKVIPEKEIGRYLNEGWVFKIQLQSGDVIVEKSIDVEGIAQAAFEEANKQIAAQTDVEKVTEKVMEQAKQQIEEAVLSERKKLLKE